MKISRLLLFALSLIPLYFAFVYVQNYGRSFPVNDQWLDSLDIAVAVHDGSLTPSAITGVYYGHRAVFTNLQIVAISALSNWQAQYELYFILFLAVLRLVMIFLIFRALAPELSAYLLLPFSLLIFASYQYLIWLSGIYSVWHFVSLFGMAAIWVLLHFPLSWKTFSAALLLAFCATFSQGSGLVVFPILLITLPLYGYRKPAHLIAWAAVMIFAIGLYFSGSPISVGGETSDTSANINLREPQIALRFLLAFLGNPFTYNLNMDLPVYVGGFGVALLILNMGYLWWAYRQTRWIAPWMTLAGFASSTGVMVYLTRYRPERFIYAIEQRYALPSSHLWLALVGTMALVLWGWHNGKLQSRPGGMLVFANIAMAVIMGALYLQANAWNLQASANRYGHLLGYEFQKDDIVCLEQYPLSGNDDCLHGSVPLGEASPDDVYRLAYYDLSLYHGQDAENIMPDDYQAGQALILNTNTPWANAYLAKWWLTGIHDIYHIARLAGESDAQLPLTYHDSLADFTAKAETIWLVIHNNAPNEAIHETLSENGYSATVYPALDLRYRDFITIVRYEKLPAELKELARFDELISLQAWSLNGEWSACDEITLQTWWQPRQKPSLQYGLRWAIWDGETQLAENSGGLSPVPNVFWESHQLYLDERRLSLPCDLPKGAIMGLEIYEADNGATLSVLSDELSLSNEKTRLLLEVSGKED